MEQLDDPNRPGSASPQEPPPEPGEPEAIEGVDPGSILGALDVTLAHGGPQAGAPPGSPAPAPAEALEPFLGPTDTLAPGEDPLSSPAFLSHGTPETAGTPPSSPERFELLGVLGRGGMGKVYRACDRQIEGRRVALKVLHPHYSADERFRELFLQEIRAAQGFVSEHVCQVRDTGRMADGSLFLTMDLVVGEPLSRVLRREGSLVPRHAFEIAVQILRGLQSGHEHGLIHRDVKPSNIMLQARVPKTEDNPFGVGVKLLDFGIAGLAEETRVGERCGTPAYMSPEAVQGQRLDARSDLFAVGVLLYEMLSGVRPFEGDTLEEIETALLETRVGPLVKELTTLPRPVRSILRKAMQKDREKRYQSAAELLQAIERAGVFRPEGEAGVLARAGVMLLGIAAGAQGTVIWHMHRQQGELEAKLASATSEAGEERDAEIARLQQRLGLKESELTLLQGRLLEEGDLGTKFVDLERDYSELREENGILRRRNEDLRARVDTLETVKRDRQLADRPEARTAACFDELLRRIEHGAGRSALEYLRSRAAEGLFAIDRRDGRALVYHLAHAAAGIELALHQSDPRRLDEARERLAEARKAELDFRLEARDWLELAPKTGAPVDRLARLRAAFDLLQERLRTASEDGATSREKEWRPIASGPDDQDPSAAHLHAERYGPDSILELLGRYAGHLERTVVQDGHLNLQALAAEDPLRSWGAWLRGPGAALEGAQADRLRRFHCAREWYVERAPAPSFAELFEEQPVLGDDTPHHDWRAQLSLQLALAGSGVYPQPADSSLVMHHRWTRSGQVLWFLERLQEKGPHAWTIERRIHNPEGATTGRSQSFELTRSEDVYYTEGFRGLDLRGVSEDIRVGVFQPGVRDSLPEKPWLQEMDLRGYGRELGSASVPCLVVRSGSTEMWFSPRFGLVRERRSGVYEREQVFFSSYR